MNPSFFQNLENLFLNQKVVSVGYDKSEAV